MTRKEQSSAMTLISSLNCSKTSRHASLLRSQVYLLATISCPLHAALYLLALLLFLFTVSLRSAVCAGLCGRLARPTSTSSPLRLASRGTLPGMLSPPSDPEEIPPPAPLQLQCYPLTYLSIYSRMMTETPTKCQANRHLVK